MFVVQNNYLTSFIIFKVIIEMCSTSWQLIWQLSTTRLVL